MARVVSTVAAHWCAGKISAGMGPTKRETSDTLLSDICRRDCACSFHRTGSLPCTWHSSAIRHKTYSASQSAKDGAGRGTVKPFRKTHRIEQDPFISVLMHSARCLRRSTQPSRDHRTHCSSPSCSASFRIRGMLTNALVTEAAALPATKAPLG